MGGGGRVGGCAWRKCGNIHLALPEERLVGLGCTMLPIASSHPLRFFLVAILLFSFLRACGPLLM